MAYAMALEAEAYALGRRRAPASAAPTRSLLLAQRDGNVDHRHSEVMNECRLPGRRVDMVETIGTVHDQRGEPPIQHGHAMDEAARDVEAGRRGGIDPERPRGHEDAVPGRGLDRHLVQRRVDIKQRRARVGTQVIIRIGGRGDPQRGDAARRAAACRSACLGGPSPPLRSRCATGSGRCR